MMGSGFMAANTVLLTMLAGHYSSLEEVGIFTLSLTTSQFLYAVGLWGVNDLQMTDYSRRYSFTHYFWTKIASTAVAAFFCLAALNVLGFGEKACRYTLLLTGFMLVNSFAELYQSLYFQNQRLDLSGKSLFFRYLFSTLAFMATLVKTKQIVYACVSMLIADMAMSMYWIMRYAPQFRDSGYALEAEKTWRLIREAFPLGISVLASLVLMNAQNYMIYLFVSDEAQGAYTLLFMPVYAVNLMSQFIFKPYLHQYSLMLKEGEDGFGSLLTKQIASIGIIVIGGALIIRILGIWLFSLFFGQDLSEYHDLMSLFMLSGGVLAVNQLLYYLMVILGKRRELLFNYMISIAITIPAGIVLIPRRVIGGAWFSFTVSQVCLMAGYVYSLSRYFSGKRVVKQTEDM
jgi:O-antigen/teichoic acid export membrane protein